MIAIQFLPSQNSNPPFQAQFYLDGASYTGIVTWNIYGQRWYFSLYDNNNNLVWIGALVGSPLGFDIPLAPGIFTSSTLLYREDTGVFEQNP